MKKQYFNEKIISYKQQDKHRTYNNKDYITSDWIIEQLEISEKCYICNEIMEYNNNSYHDLNMTVDRVNNDYAHIKNNCKLACIHCNVSKK